MTSNWSRIGVGVLLICSCFVLCQETALAKKAVSNIPDPDKLVSEAQAMVTEKQKALYEQLPVNESANNGYWWNKQDKSEKLAYVKELVVDFKLADKKLSVKKIVQALDIEYSPRDNPLDIKIDKSIERMFNIVTEEMLLK